MTQGNDRPDRFRVAFDPAAGRARLQAEARSLRAMLDAATPPEEMRGAPVAPARPTMRLVDNFVLQPGGTRLRDGKHWITPSNLDVLNVQFAAAHPAPEGDRKPRAIFSPGQVAMAETYRALVEWRNGAPLRGSRLDAGHAGQGGAGLFIDSYLDRGRALDRLVRAIGPGVALAPTRHQDRDNARRPIPVLVLVNRVVLDAWSIARVLDRHGWARKTLHIRALRAELCAALDRMQGYDGADPQNRVLQG